MSVFFLFMYPKGSHGHCNSSAVNLENKTQGATHTKKKKIQCMQNAKKKKTFKCILAISAVIEICT